MIRAWWRRLRARRFRPVARLDEADLLKGFSLTEDHPTWKALECVLEEAIEESVLIVSSYQTAEKPGLLTHTAGGIEALRELRGRLRELRAKAMDPQQE